MKRRYIKKGWEPGEEKEFVNFYRSPVVCGRCGHKRDMHEFIDFGKEGKCEESGCPCHLFLSAVPVETCFCCEKPYVGEPMGVTEPACKCGRNGGCVTCGRCHEHCPCWAVSKPVQSESINPVRHQRML